MDPEAEGFTCGQTVQYAASLSDLGILDTDCPLVTAWMGECCGRTKVVQLLPVLDLVETPRQRTVLVLVCRRLRDLHLDSVLVHEVQVSRCLLVWQVLVRRCTLLQSSQRSIAHAGRRRRGGSVFFSVVFSRFFYFQTKSSGIGGRERGRPETPPTLWRTTMKRACEDGVETAECGGTFEVAMQINTDQEVEVAKGQIFFADASPPALLKTLDEDHEELLRAAMQKGF